MNVTTSALLLGLIASASSGSRAIEDQTLEEDCGCSLIPMPGSGGGNWDIVVFDEHGGLCPWIEGHGCPEQTLPCFMNYYVDWDPPTPPPCGEDDMNIRWRNTGSGTGGLASGNAVSLSDKIDCGEFVQFDVMCPPATVVASLLVICFECGL